MSALTARGVIETVDDMARSEKLDDSKSASACLPGTMPCVGAVTNMRVCVCGLGEGAIESLQGIVVLGDD